MIFIINCLKDPAQLAEASRITSTFLTFKSPDLISHFGALLRKHLLKEAVEEQPLGKGTVVPVKGDTGARAGPHVDRGVEKRGWWVRGAKPKATSRN